MGAGLMVTCMTRSSGPQILCMPSLTRIPRQGEDGRDLPQASDKSIRVTGSPPQVQGVATFSGVANQTLAAAKAAELRNNLREDGHTPADATSWQLAQYNSPLVPGFLRRNEVLIPLSDYKLW